MQIVNRTQALRLLGMAVLAAVLPAAASAQSAHVSTRFAGPKANTGTALHSFDGGRSVLRVSQDFQVPDTPAPTWRVVDSQGHIYTLDAFKTKGGEKREIVVPAYVRDIAKVQVYCAWAEVLLGESSFPMPVASMR